MQITLRDPLPYKKLKALNLVSAKLGFEYATQVAVMACSR